MVEVEKPLRADELAVRHLDILRHAQREGEGLIGGGRNPPPVKQPLRIAGRLRRRPARPRHVVNTHVAQEDVPRVAHGPHEWFQLCDGRSRAIQRAQQCVERQIAQDRSRIAHHKGEMFQTILAGPVEHRRNELRDRSRGDLWPLEPADLPPLAPDDDPPGEAEPPRHAIRPGGQIHHAAAGVFSCRQRTAKCLAVVGHVVASRAEVPRVEYLVGPARGLADAKPRPPTPPDRPARAIVNPHLVRREAKVAWQRRENAVGVSLDHAHWDDAAILLPQHRLHPSSVRVVEHEVPADDLDRRTRRRLVGAHPGQ